MIITKEGLVKDHTFKTVNEMVGPCKYLSIAQAQVVLAIAAKTGDNIFVTRNDEDSITIVRVDDGTIHVIDVTVDGDVQRIC